MGTMKAADLHRIITEAQNFASTDGTLPAINVVQIEVGGDAILAVATDRFSLGASRAAYDGSAVASSGEDWSFGLHPDERKQLLGAAKTPAKNVAWREVTIKLAENGYVVFEFNDGMVLRLRQASEDFPKWRGLVPSKEQVLHSAVHKAIAFTPSILAKFAKISGKHMRMVQCYGPNGWKPISVTMADRDDFFGIIMPVNLDHKGDDDEQSLPSWLI